MTRACSRASRRRTSRGTALLGASLGWVTLTVACAPAPPAPPAAPDEPRVAARAPCEEGAALDLRGERHGARAPNGVRCAAPEQVHAIAQAAHLLLSESDVLTCEEGVLALTKSVDGDGLDCIPRRSACDAHQTWSSRRARCVPQARCPQGSILDGKGRCLLIAKDAKSVDVATWARVRLGLDGGAAEASLCASLERAPRTFGLSRAREIPVGVALDLVFPDNDVSSVRARWQITVDGLAANHEATALVEDALQARVAELAPLGGTARAASVHLEVECRLRGMAGPSTTPRPRGHGGAGGSSSDDVR